MEAEQKIALFDIPSVQRKPWGWLGLLLNILPVAGVGSITNGWRYKHKGLLLAGALQTSGDLVGVVFVGLYQANWPIPVVFVAWVWSIVWGIRIFRRAF